MATVVRGLWVGEALSLVERLCVKSFLDHGHRFLLYAYGEVANAPESAEIRDAGEVIDRRHVFTPRRGRHKGSLAAFADWFRHELMLREGGFYVDMDIICLKPFDFPQEMVFGLESAGCANSAVMRFPKGHALTRHITEIYASPASPLPYDSPRMRRVKFFRRHFLGNKRHYIGWAEAGGPLGFTQALKHYGLFHHALPATHFFPIPAKAWRSVFDAANAGGGGTLDNSYALHLWNERIQRRRFNVVTDPHPRSLFAQLLRRHSLR